MLHRPFPLVAALIFACASTASLANDELDALKVDEKAMGTIIGAAIGALAGLVVGLSAAFFNYRISQRKRADELFASALGHLGGGSQNRNLGIAAITLYWRQFPQHTELCAETLVGSAIYLLSRSKQKDAAHELFNLQRIMNLLKELSKRVRNRSSYVHLKQFLAQRLVNYDPRPARGLWVLREDLEKWQKELN